MEEQNWSSFVKKYAHGFVPLLMCTVLCVQLAASWLYDLSRWKGAGMGMFSEISERTVFITSDDIIEGYELKVPQELNKQRKALETLPNNYFADRLWNRMSSQVYYQRLSSTGMWEQVNRPSLNFGDRISYEEADEFTSSMRTWYRAANAFEPLRSGTIQVYAVDTYSPTDGTVTTRKIFEKSYPPSL